MATDEDLSQFNLSTEESSWRPAFSQSRVKGTNKLVKRIYVPIKDANDFQSAPQVQFLCEDLYNIQHNSIPFQSTQFLPKKNSRIMLDQRQILSGKSSHGHQSTRDFRFEIPVEPHSKDGTCAYSPRLWKLSAPVESSPLLPETYQSSNLSPKSRIQAIKEGRRQLMEMVQDMSESSFELSLKDIIVGEQHDKEETISKEGSFQFNSSGSRKLRKTESTRNIKREKPKQIFKSASMESDVFLIKMFPRLIVKTKKKVAAGNTVKISSTPSFNKPEMRMEKDQRRTSFLATQDQNTGKISSTIINSKDRHEDDTSLPGCWSLFSSQKSKTSRHGWII